jgi:hypothetical protein
MRYNLRSSANVPDTAVIMDMEIPCRITVAEAEQFVRDVRANLSEPEPKPAPKPARYRLRYKRPGQDERNLIVAGVTVDRAEGTLRFVHPAVWNNDGPWQGKRCGPGTGFPPSGLIEFTKLPN